MFEGLHQQNIADYLKGPVLALPTPDLRREGLAWIKQLESVEWHGAAFEVVFGRLGRSYRMAAGHMNFDGTPREMLDTLAAIVQAYLDEIEPVISDDLMTTGRACQYVSQELAKRGRKLSPSSVKEYIWERRMIRGELVGNTMVFRRADLDAFVESYLVLDPRRGRRWHKEPLVD